MQLALDLGDDRLIEAAAAGQQDRGREAGTVRVAGLGEQGAGVGRVVLGQEVGVAPTGDARRDHRVRDLDGAVRVGQGHDPAPVDGLAEGLADPDVIERRPVRREPVVLERQRCDVAQLRAERLVVGDPRGIDARDRRVVEIAGLERLDRARATERRRPSRSC